jgi:hypothetical protein
MAKCSICNNCSNRCIYSNGKTISIDLRNTIRALENFEDCPPNEREFYKGASFGSRGGPDS